MSMVHPLLEIVCSQKRGIPAGIVSVCSANEYVIEAAIAFSKEKDSSVLIEATCNQVNQFGGYTGMIPTDFKKLVYSIAESQGFPKEKIILGGDHLGPNPWKNENSAIGMEKAIELLKEYVKAGFTKIHLDASMNLGDDPNGPLDLETIAERSAILCRAAEKAFADMPKGSLYPVYVIGTEVPVPGGTTSDENKTEVTTPENLEKTVTTTKRAFEKLDLYDAWKRVLAVVVQPGVEFGDEWILEYDRDVSKDLTAELKKYPEIVFEGHSTDYQKSLSLKKMVEDGIAILKVGPALTFAFREAVFSLNNIEKELIGENSEKYSNIIGIVDKIMVEHPENWRKYYKGTKRETELARKYSQFDRIRYYWNNPKVEEALNRLLKNLESIEITHTLLSQFMPFEYMKVRRKEIKNSPKELIRSHISSILGQYHYATNIIK